MSHWRFIVVLLALLAWPSAVQAGGTTSPGYGFGKYVPKSNLLVTWSWYGSGATEPRVNELSYAVASVDHDTLRWRLLYSDPPIEGVPHVFFSFKGSTPTDPECLDDIVGNCVLAEAACLVYTSDSPLRVCTQYRIFLWVNNMEAAGVAASERLFPIARHELGHAMGFDHGMGGPMSNGLNDWTACQLAQWDTFTYSPSAVGWASLPLAECPQAMLSEEPTGKCVWTE